MSKINYNNQYNHNMPGAPVWLIILFMILCFVSLLYLGIEINKEL